MHFVHRCISLYNKTFCFYVKNAFLAVWRELLKIKGCFCRYPYGNDLSPYNPYTFQSTNSEWQDYSGVDSTTSSFEPRNNAIDNVVPEQNTLPISKGKLLSVLYVPQGLGTARKGCYFPTLTRLTVAGIKQERLITHHQVIKQESVEDFEPPEMINDFVDSTTAISANELQNGITDNY